MAKVSSSSIQRPIGYVLLKKKKSIRFLKLIRKKSDVICKPYGLKTDFMESGPLEMPVLFKLLIPTLEGGFRA